MLKLAVASLLVAGAIGAAPAFADSKSGDGGIGRGCTLDPFNHTMRCIDFDHCTTDANGNKTCPIVVTPTRATAAGQTTKGGQRRGQSNDYLVVTMDQVLISD